MKRRGFLGVLGAGAVSAPAIAQNAFQHIPSSMSGQGIGSVLSGSGNIGINACAGSLAAKDDWRATEILNLRKIISGALSDREKDSIRLTRLDAQERELSQAVMSLVSVSPVRKMSMYSNLYSKHQERMQIEDAKQRLHWLLRDQE